MIYTTLAMVLKILILLFCTIFVIFIIGVTLNSIYASYKRKQNRRKREELTKVLLYYGIERKHGQYWFLKPVLDVNTQLMGSFFYTSKCSYGMVFVNGIKIGENDDCCLPDYIVKNIKLMETISNQLYNYY